jgi:ubiquinone/menaquinone biosynthesis C-methylase UbiE
MASTFAPQDVAAFEHATWSRCAPGYAEGFATLTGEAIPRLLEAARVGQGSRVLDIGTGTGVAAAAAHRLGAKVVGVDFSDAMLAEARQRIPDIEFRSATAETLLFADTSFDAVLANAVLHHLGDPAGALREASRVLAPNGRIACTVWAEPEKLEAFGLFFAAVEEHAGAAELPHGPLFGVTDRETIEPLLAGSGFENIELETLDITWRMKSIDTLLHAFGTWAQLDSFPEATRHAIEADVRSAAARYTDGDGLSIPNPMLLISATRSG